MENRQNQSELNFHREAFVGALPFSVESLSILVGVGAQSTATLRSGILSLYLQTY